MNEINVDQDIRYIKEVLARTHRRVDPHAFHYVHWGAIVFVWFPLLNYFVNTGGVRHLNWLNPVAIGVGVLLSTLREIPAVRRHRLAGENTFISRQVVMITFATLAAGMILSVIGPLFGVFTKDAMPMVSGLMYANIAFMVGVVYTRDFLWSGVAIFAGVLLAMAYSDYSAYILGPIMGLGMIVPGMRAERRVRQLSAENAGANVGSL